MTWRKWRAQNVVELWLVSGWSSWRDYRHAKVLLLQSQRWRLKIEWLSGGIVTHVSSFESLKDYPFSHQCFKLKLSVPVLSTSAILICTLLHAPAHCIGFSSFSLLCGYVMLLDFALSLSDATDMYEMMLLLFIISRALTLTSFHPSVLWTKCYQ